jgi:hypothetical protein
MVSGKRKFQEDAAPAHSTRHWKDELAEFALHLALRIQAANRLRLTKVRLDMLDMTTALALADVLTEAINAETRRRNLSLSKPRTRS